MGKHSKERKINFKKCIFIISIVIVLIAVWFVVKNLNKVEDNISSIKDSKTIEGERLVFKSTNDYNKIIEYTFEKDSLKTIKIYEQFENIDDFNAKKVSYESQKNIKILNINEQELSIEIEKEEFGTDKNLSYDQVYNKYLVQIINAYTIIY